MEKFFSRGLAPFFLVFFLVSNSFGGAAPLPKDNTVQGAVVSGSTVTVAAPDTIPVNKAKADFIVPDGSTSAQVTINQALLSLPLSGGKVLLLAGTYNIDGSVLINGCNGSDFTGCTAIARKNIAIEGEGPSTIINWSGSNTHYGPMFMLGSNFGWGATLRGTVLIKDIQFVGNWHRPTWGSGQTGIALQQLQSYDITIKSCRFRGLQTGIGASGGNVFLINNHFESSLRAMGSNNDVFSEKINSGGNTGREVLSFYIGGGTDTMFTNNISTTSNITYDFNLVMDYAGIGSGLNTAMFGSNILKIPSTSPYGWGRVPVRMLSFMAGTTMVGNNLSGGYNIQQGLSYNGPASRNNYGLIISGNVQSFSGVILQHGTQGAEGPRHVTDNIFTGYDTAASTPTLNTIQVTGRWQWDTTLIANNNVAAAARSCLLVTQETWRTLIADNAFRSCNTAAGWAGMTHPIGVDGNATNPGHLLITGNTVKRITTAVGASYGLNLWGVNHGAFNNDLSQTGAASGGTGPYWQLSPANNTTGGNIL